MRLPRSLELDMIFGRQLPGTHWALSVTLNNRLLHQDIFDGNQTSYNAMISLPADMQNASNTIEIMASTTQSSKGRCDRGPTLMSEMLPTTRLLAADATYTDPMMQLHQTLSEIRVLGIGVFGRLGAADADAASALLAQLVPASEMLKPDAANARIVVIPPQSADFNLPETGAIWLVTQDAITRQAQVALLEPGSLLPRRGLAILVVPDAMNVTQASL
jgi:hypothetical protein